MATSFTLSDEVRGQLSAALLEEQDLLGALHGQRPVETPESPGTFRCNATLAMRRPFDPETAEMRSLVVHLKRQDAGWLIFAVEGLDVEDLAD